MGVLTQDPLTAQGILAGGWLGFALLHSLLAGNRLKNAMIPAAQPFYRLGYNCLACLHFAALIWLEQRGLPIGWTLDAGAGRWGLIAIQIAGLMLILYSFRRYDLGLFSGLTEARQAIRKQFAHTGRPDNAHPDSSPIGRPQPEPLSTTGLNAYMRHPLYSGVFLILWARVTNDLGLATAIWGSLYLLIGYRFEERRLCHLYGAAYRRYQKAVPAFIPWKGRVVIDPAHTDG